MDHQLGKLFERIHTDPALRDNTLILIYSDNGPEFGVGSADPFRGNKAMLYEGGIRSPLIVWGPGFTDPKKVGTTNLTSHFSTIDLVPSLLAITGVSPPPDTDFDGVSMRDTLLGRSEASRDRPLFFRRPPDRTSFSGDDNLPDLAVCDGRWKLLCAFDGSTPLLHDLALDPSEKKNLAEEHPTETAASQRLPSRGIARFPPTTVPRIAHRRRKSNRRRAPHDEMRREGPRRFMEKNSRRLVSFLPKPP